MPLIIRQINRDGKEKKTNCCDVLITIFGDIFQNLKKTELDFVSPEYTLEEYIRTHMEDVKPSAYYDFIEINIPRHFIITKDTGEGVRSHVSDHKIEYTLFIEKVDFSKLITTKQSLREYMNRRGPEIRYLGCGKYSICIPKNYIITEDCGKGVERRETNRGFKYIITSYNVDFSKLTNRPNI